MLAGFLIMQAGCLCTTLAICRPLTPCAQVIVSDVLVKRGIMLLRPQNIAVLGGQVRGCVMLNCRHRPYIQLANKSVCAATRTQYSRWPLSMAGRCSGGSTAAGAGALGEACRCG